jgi:hypothetical protein
MFDRRRGRKETTLEVANLRGEARRISEDCLTAGRLVAELANCWHATYGNSMDQIETHLFNFGASDTSERWAVESRDVLSVWLCG